MTKNKWIYFLIFLIALIVLGWLRDGIFIRLNYQIMALEWEEPFWPYKGIYSFMNTNSVSTLYTYKWILTITYYVLHWGMAILMVRWFFQQKWNYRIVHLVFAALFLLSGISYVIFGPHGIGSPRGYELARILMGAGQSPVLIMILAVIFRVRSAQ